MQTLFLVLLILFTFITPRFYKEPFSHAVLAVINLFLFLATLSYSTNPVVITGAYLVGIMYTVIIVRYLNAHTKYGSINFNKDNYA